MNYTPCLHTGRGVAGYPELSTLPIPSLNYLHLPCGPELIKPQAGR